MPANNRYITNQPLVTSEVPTLKNVQIGIVVSIDDPLGMNRIKVSIPGPANKGGDDGTSLDLLPWCIPMTPKFFTSVPKLNELVFVIFLDSQKTHSDRLYFGPIIPQLNYLNFSDKNNALSPFTFGTRTTTVNFDNIPALRGVFPKNDDIAIQGRYNTDIILRKNEILIRAGKFVESTPNENNPYFFEFNNTTQGYIQIRNDIPIERANERNEQQKGSVTNIVGSKINLLTHANGDPRFNLLNQNDQLSNDEILNILENAHPLPFGDILVQYLKLFKTAFINHVHNNNGLKPTGTGDKSVQNFVKQAEALEAAMLSKNIRIN